MRWSWRRVVAGPLLVLGLALGVAHAQPAIEEIAFHALPPEAHETIARIERGGPFPYRRDGITFRNRERLLPARPESHYREYTVPTPGARDRGARRIVTSRDGSMYYTADHYRSFRRIRR